MSNTHRSRGKRVSFEMIARTSCVTDPVKSHSVCARDELLAKLEFIHRRTVDLFQDSLGCVSARWRSRGGPIGPTDRGSFRVRGPV